MSQKRTMPTMTVSVTTKQRRCVEQASKKQKTSLSAVVRQALDHYLNP